jgi:alkanesulfonate monooxygenase SsuD/methylene tetrahydromethanopterin reductase-like flavin-dependent oxidoreductase (luciferase family)
MLTDDSAAAEQAKAGPMGSRTIAGNADDLIGQIAEYEALGFDEMIVPDWNLGETPAARRDSLERIQSEVIAQLD